MKSSLIIALLMLAQHVHPPVLPTDETTWFQCCHDFDCREAHVLIVQRGDELSKVAVNGEVFEVWNHRVHRSQNGHSYVCTYSGQPPTQDNILCVFYLDPGGQV